MPAGLYKLVTVLAIVGMGVILFIAVAPPNGPVFWVVTGFIAIALVVWNVFESRRFQGPPIGVAVQKRGLLIKAAEKAFGEL
jgi:hypothetical protein